MKNAAHSAGVRTQGAPVTGMINVQDIQGRLSAEVPGGGTVPTRWDTTAGLIIHPIIPITILVSVARKHHNFIDVTRHVIYCYTAFFFSKSS